MPRVPRRSEGAARILQGGDSRRVAIYPKNPAPGDISKGVDFFLFFFFFLLDK